MLEIFAVYLICQKTVAKPIHAESSSKSSFTAMGNLEFSLKRDLRKGEDDISNPWDKR